MATLQELIDPIIASHYPAGGDPESGPAPAFSDQFNIGSGWTPEKLAQANARLAQLSPEQQQAFAQGAYYLQGWPDQVMAALNSPDPVQAMQQARSFVDNRIAESNANSDPGTFGSFQSCMSEMPLPVKIGLGIIGGAAGGLIPGVEGIGGAAGTTAAGEFSFPNVDTGWGQGLTSLVGEAGGGPSPLPSFDVGYANQAIGPNTILSGNPASSSLDTLGLQQMAQAAGLTGQAAQAFVDAGGMADTSSLSGLPGYSPPGTVPSSDFGTAPGTSSVPGGTTPGGTGGVPGTGTIPGTGATGGGTGGGTGSGGFGDFLRILPNIIGAASGVNSMLNRTPAVDPNMVNALWQAGQNTYNTSLDPQGDLYRRTQQQLQEQTRAAQSARGLAMSPYAAGIENKAMSDFNIDWANQQLNRQVAGTGAFSGAGNVAATAGIANNAQAFMQNQTGLNNLTTALSGTPGGMTYNPATGQWTSSTANPGLINQAGSWLSNLWGSGSTPSPAWSGYDWSQFNDPNFASNFNWNPS